MKIKNTIIVSFTTYCLLSVAFSPVVYAAAVPIPENASDDVMLPSPRLSPQEMLWVEFLQYDKDNAEHQKIRKDAIKEAIKKTGDIQALERNIRYGYLYSMVALGEFYEQQEHFQTAYEWYILAFEEHYLNTAKHLPSAKKKLENIVFIEAVHSSLTERAKEEKQKFFENFHHKKKGFFAQYEEDPSVLLKIIFSFTIRKPFDQSPYLTQEDHDARHFRFLAKMLELKGDRNPWGTMGQNYEKKKDYINAFKFYKRSGSQIALYNIGVLYKNGFLDNGIPNYKKAAEYFEQSNIPEALCFIGILNMLGHLSDDHQPNYKEAAKYFEQSKTPNALCLIGILNMHGHLSDDHQLDYKKAAKYFEQSNIPEALFFLGGLHARGCLSADNTPNYEEALIYLSQALMQGHAEAAQYIKEIENVLAEIAQLKQQEKNLKEATVYTIDTMVDNRAEASQYQAVDIVEEPISAFSMSDDSDEDLNKLPIDMEEKQNFESSPSIDDAALLPIIASKQNLRKSTRLEKIAKKEEKLQADIRKALARSLEFRSTHASLGDTDVSEVVKPLDITFLSGDIKKGYETLRNNPRSKLHELIQEIEDKPWATVGAGKPEVLRHELNGYKGCISRRLDAENRLVYKVMGPRQILILECIGHYE